MNATRPMHHPTRAPVRWRRRFARYRRWFAAACAAAAVATTVQALTPPAPPTVPVPVAAHDLAAGRVLGPSDLVTVAWPKGTRPDGILAAPVGRVLSAAVRRGEPLTDARVTGPGLLAGQPAGTVAVTVRLSDPAATTLLASGRRIDVVGGPIGGTGGTAGEAEVLAADVLVLTVPRGTAEGSGDGWPDTAGADPAAVGAGVAGGSGDGATAGGSVGSGSGIVVVAADRATAARLATAAGTRSISAVLTG
jgi:pilus assembly protein CpaB